MDLVGAEVEAEAKYREMFQNIQNDLHGAHDALQYAISEDIDNSEDIDALYALGNLFKRLGKT